MNEETLNFHIAISHQIVLFHKIYLSVLSDCLTLNSRKNIFIFIIFSLKEDIEIIIVGYIPLFIFKSSFADMFFNNRTQQVSLSQI